MRRRREGAWRVREVLVVGGTGATGRRLVRLLLERGHRVRVIVRSAERVAADVREHPALRVVVGTVLEMDEAALREEVRGCGAVASCLGHRLSLGGMLGPPWRLVRDSAQRLCSAIESGAPSEPVRLVLMSSAGVRGPGERVSLAEWAVTAAVRALVPPHADNEAASAFLRSRTTVGAVEWACVRPDGLQEGDEIGRYSVHASPTRSAIFNAGRTKRVQVADFMARLIAEDALWDEWARRMPVLYDTGGTPESQ